MHIPFPKYPDKGAQPTVRASRNISFFIHILFYVHIIGYAFRHDGRYFVLSERYKSKDMLGVYDTADFYKQARVRIYLNLILFLLFNTF